MASEAMFDIEVQSLHCLAHITKLDKLVKIAINRDALDKEEINKAYELLQEIWSRVTGLEMLLEDEASLSLNLTEG